MPSSNFDIKNLIEKIKNTKRVFWFLAVHIFFVILVLILFDILFGGLLFYKYIILTKNQEPSTTGKSFKFEEAIYQEIIGELASRQKNFESIIEVKYSDPFQSK
ncbi:MAG: hypothetical protein AAB509_01770 [Patescibacteria group bacterium]